MFSQLKARRKAHKDAAERRFAHALAEKRREQGEFWDRVAERDRQARVRKAERQKEFIKQAVREVLNEREADAR